MTSFAPINDDHAVTSVLFGLQFDEFIEPSTLDTIRNANPWPIDLPAVSSLPPLYINQGGHNYPIPVLQVAIVRPDGRPIWGVKFAGHDLVVECTAYSRWDATWEKARAYLEQAFSIIRSHQPDINIVDFRLQVTDAFRSDDEKNDIQQLIAPNNRFVPPIAYDGRNVWNSSTGWFEIISDIQFTDALAVQVQGRGESDAITSPYLVSIQHFGRALTSDSPAPNIGRLDEIVQELHKRNKGVVGELLSENARTRIGLKP